MSSRPSSSDQYWACAPVDELGEKVEKRFTWYRTDLYERKRGKRIRQASLRYYGFDPDDSLGTSSDLEFGGEQGETVLAQVNHFRSLVRSMKALATSSRPAFDAVAVDDKPESAEACALAEQIWDHELEVGLERVLSRADERMLVQSEAAVGVFWDPDSGSVVGTEPLYERDHKTGEPLMDDVEVTEETEQFDPTLNMAVMGQHARTEQQPRPQLDADGMAMERGIHEGAITYEVFGPGDCARDPEVTDLSRPPWTIVRRKVHRWDVLAGLIQGSKLWNVVRGVAGIQRHSGTTSRQDEASASVNVTDQIWALELYHDKTAACPEGRYARVIDGEVVEEGPLQYERVPVILRAPAVEFDRSAGYADSWDLLGVSKAVDLVVSDLTSYAEKYGEMVAMIPEGADIEAADLVGGGAVKYKWQEGMPAPAWMPVPPINKGLMDFLEYLEKHLQVQSGVNSVVRGDPEASLKSGAALALVQAMAVQHASEFQAVAADLRREVATMIVEVYRAFASTPRLLTIAGDEKSAVRTFQGDELMPVQRIRATLANPLLRTIAGKKEVVDDLMQKFPDEPPLTRAQYIEFLETGRYNPLFKSDLNRARNVAYENDRFTKGEEVIGRLLDHHENHIAEHNAMIDGAQRYELPVETIVALEQHINWHGQVWTMLTNSNPALLAATNQRPAPMPAPVGMPPGPGGPPQNGPPGPGGPPPPNGGPAPVESMGPVMGENPIPGTGPEAASMPKAPMNPATGERVQLPDAAMG